MNVLELQKAVNVARNLIDRRAKSAVTPASPCYERLIMYKID